MWTTIVGNADVPQQVGGSTDVAKLSLPGPASYVVHLTATASDDVAGNDEVTIACFLRRNATDTISEADAYLTRGGGPKASLAITAVVALTDNGTVDVMCGSQSGSDHLDNISLTALKVGTVHTQ